MAMTIWEEHDVVERIGPDGTIERVVVDRGRIVGATSWCPEAHTPVRPIPLTP
jgi:hypothetical protein